MVQHTFVWVQQFLEQDPVIDSPISDNKNIENTTYLCLLDQKRRHIRVQFVYNV